MLDKPKTEEGAYVPVPRRRPGPSRAVPGWRRATPVTNLATLDPVLRRGTGSPIYRTLTAQDAYAANWFIVLCAPPAFNAASPAKYSLWSSPMSEPDMFWCFTQAIPSRISLRCTPLT